MKKIILVLFLIATATSAQTTDNLKPFSTFGFRVFAGINFEKTSDAFHAYDIEANTNLFSNLELTLGIGHQRIIDRERFLVKTFKFSRIDDDEWYSAIQYYINSVDYQVIPLKIGIKYNLPFKNLKLYLLANTSYNFIDPFGNKGGENVINTYDSFEEIPVEYQSANQAVNGSYGITVGIGFSYNLIEKLLVDVRYQIQSDSEILNTHQILFGIGI